MAQIVSFTPRPGPDHWVIIRHRDVQDRTPGIFSVAETSDEAFDRVLEMAGASHDDLAEWGYTYDLKDTPELCEILKANITGLDIEACTYELYRTRPNALPAVIAAINDNEFGAQEVKQAVAGGKPEGVVVADGAFTFRYKSTKFQKAKTKHPVTLWLLGRMSGKQVIGTVMAITTLYGGQVTLEAYVERDRATRLAAVVADQALRLAQRNPDITKDAIERRNAVERLEAIRMKTKLILGSNGVNSGTPSELDYVADLFQDPRI